MHSSIVDSTLAPAMTPVEVTPLPETLNDPVSPFSAPSTRFLTVAPFSTPNRPYAWLSPVSAASILRLRRAYPCPSNVPSKAAPEGVETAVVAANVPLPMGVHWATSFRSMSFISTAVISCAPVPALTSAANCTSSAAVRISMRSLAAFAKKTGRSTVCSIMS